MTKPFASLSLDLDNMWAYQMTHGDPGWETYPTYLPELVPRALDLLGSLGLRITFFVVGRDAHLADRNGDALAALAADGHEIGNHSFDHKPWLHTWSRDQVDDDLARTEEALVTVTGRRPTGFRGPGYALSVHVLEVLSARGYVYDCSTLPTFIGPAARWYYFRAAQLTPEQRAERSNLFGSFREGFRPVGPYRWSLPSGAAMTEIPVTTMPGARVPVHVSYLLTLAGISPAAADAYWAAALGACKATGLAPSILLHPLDLLGADDVSALEFFPAMDQPGATKRRHLARFLARLTDSFEVGTMAEHAHRLVPAHGRLAVRDAATAGPLGPSPMSLIRRVRRGGTA